MIRRVAIAIAAVLLLAPASALAYTSPACVTEDGCSFSSCLGAYNGTTTYYFCDCVSGTHSGATPASGCTVGNDTNSGTSPTSPYRTFSKLQSKFAGMQPGDRLLMCNGGVFSGAGASSFVNHNCTAGNPCAVGGYSHSSGTGTWGTGSEGRPVIDVTSGNGIDMNEGSDVIEHGYQFVDFIISGPGGPTTNGSGDAFFVYNQVNDGMICNVEARWFSLAVDNSGGNNSTDLNKNWTLRNNDFTQNSGQGILGTNDGSAYANNKVTNNGFSNNTFNHNIYAVECDGCTFTGNELYQSSLTASSGGKCDGSEWVVHGVNNNIDFVGNYVHDDVGVVTGSCYGMQFVPGYTSAEMNSNFVIERNYILNVASNGINLAATHGGDIRNNVVVMTEFISAGISATNDSVVSAQGDWSNQDITIQGNTILLVNAGVGITMVDTMVRGISRDNVVYLQQASGTGYCFTYDQSTGSYSAIDYNACYRSTGGTLNWESSTGDTFAAWKTATSFDTHSINATNPLFTNVGTLDFSLQSGSPLRDVGTTGPSNDFIGTTRPQNGTTDIGAYEFIVSTSVTAGKGRVAGFGGF